MTVRYVRRTSDITGYITSGRTLETLVTALQKLAANLNDPMATVGIEYNHAGLETIYVNYNSPETPEETKEREKHEARQAKAEAKLKDNTEKRERKELERLTKKYKVK